jgi:hypothetical protein
VKEEGEDSQSEGTKLVNVKTERDRVRKENAEKRIYRIAGYPDNQNLWDKLLNIDK